MAALEYLGTLSDMGDAPDDLVAVAAEIDENKLETVDAASLPGWEAIPADASVQFGSAWARERRTVALRVPSVMIPSEANYVINPEHPDFERAVVVGDSKPFSFDPRLLRLVR